MTGVGITRTQDCRQLSPLSLANPQELALMLCRPPQLLVLPTLYHNMVLHSLRKIQVLNIKCGNMIKAQILNRVCLFSHLGT